jgi:hypothetical protein
LNLYFVENCRSKNGKETKGKCKGACGRVAGFKTVITPKLVTSPARYGGEECDLEPEEIERECITDCCPGKADSLAVLTATVSSQSSAMRLPQRPTLPAVSHVDLV